MLIANPIYDVVFKYLLDDNKCAKILISTIIGEKVVKLTYKPTEERIDLEELELTVYRLDFSAKIKATDGTYKHVIIEIQKASSATDVMRFRKYLGQQYIKSHNLQESKGKYRAKNDPIVLPIVSIYFLGEKLKHIKVPVVHVKRNYIDLATGDIITAKEAFIESLTHDSFVIQIQYLKKHRRNDLEQLLSIFDQGNQTQESHHIMRVLEEDFPKADQKLIIRRLQKANEEPKIRKTMDIEDEIMAKFYAIERKVGKLERVIDKRDKLIEDKDKVIEDNMRAMKTLNLKLAALEKKLLG